jgi:hypothetical protein
MLERRIAKCLCQTHAGLYAPPEEIETAGNIDIQFHRMSVK